MNIVHRGRQRVQLGAGLTTFLELALETGQDVVETEAAFTRRSHTTTHPAHPTKRLGL